MSHKSIVETVKAIDKKIIYAASVAAAIAVLGVGYTIVGKNNSYAGVPKKS